MKKQRLLLFAVLISLTAFFVSCKKHNNDASTRCRIVDVKTSDTSNSEIIFTYDSSKRLSSITRLPNGTKQTFSYSGNLIIRNDFTYLGTPLTTDTIAVGPNGLISTILHVWPFANKILAYDTASYDNKNQLTRFITTDHTSSNITTYSWDNGDATMVNYNGKSVAYNYYTDKKASYGDLLWLYDILNYGMSIVRCQHLVKEASGATVVYKFDSDGKIINATETYQSTTLTYDYTYSCD